ncbi:MAG: hypothetical protein RL463_275 [Bacteroidota bacterium]|jgi:hypothetical protein
MPRLIVGTMIQQVCLQYSILQLNTNMVLLLLLQVEKTAQGHVLQLPVRSVRKITQQIDYFERIYERVERITSETHMNLLPSVRNISGEGRNIEDIKK